MIKLKYYLIVCFIACGSSGFAQFVSADVVKKDTSAVIRGTTDNPVLCVQVVTSGGAGLPVSRLDFNANGTTDTSEIRNLKVFYTGNSSVFHTLIPFGDTLKALPGTSNYDFGIGGQVLLTADTGYFWLTYDIAPGATPANKVDGSCLSITFNGLTYPVTVSSLPGQRKIKPEPLSGNYTIGGPSAAYPAIADAVSDLNERGISGPVQFDLNAGVYNERVMIDPVTGASFFNTITFKGAGTALTTVSVPGTTNNVNGSGAAVSLRGADHIIFRDMRIEVNGQGNEYGEAVYGTNVADHNSFINLEIGLSGTNTTGILFAGGNAGNNNLFDSLQVTGGARGISLNGASVMSYTSGNTIRNSTFNNQLAASIYIYSQSFITIHQNRISQATGQAATAITIVGAANYAFTNNTIITEGTGINQTYGNYMNYLGIPSRIANNMITCKGGSEAVIIGSFSNHVKFYHNSLWGNISLPTRGVLTITTTTGTGIDVKNNYLYNDYAGNTGYTLHVTPAAIPAIIGMDGNNYTSVDQSARVFFGTAMQDLPALRAAYPFLNIHSFNVPSDFISPTDLSLSGKRFTPRVPHTGDSMDINGIRRYDRPVIGASELPFTLHANSIAAIRFTDPAGVFSGNNLVRIQVANAGADTIGSFTVHWQVNGIAQPSVTVTEHIDTLFSDSGNMKTVALDSVYFPPGAATTIMAWVSDPNGVPDANTGDDTIRAVFRTPLDGVYTIGGPSADFASFTEAAAVLNNTGISGPVRFIVAPGTYAEQVTIGPVAGVSDTSSIIFDGGNGNASTRILSQPPAFNIASARSIVQLNRVKHVHFRNLTFRNTHSAGIGINILGLGSGNISIRHCTVISGDGTSAAGVAVNNNPSNPTSGAGVRISDIVIDSNVFDGGYHGIVFNAAADTSLGLNNVISNNEISNINRYAIWLNYQNGITIYNNKIAISETAGLANSDAIYITNLNTSGPNTVLIRNNVIRNIVRFGISVSTTVNPANNPALIINNVLTDFRGTASTGIALGNSRHWKVAHNTVYMNNMVSGTNNAAVSVSDVQSSGISILNNILMTDNALSTALPLYIKTSASLDTLDYNLYYRDVAPSGTLIMVGDTAFTQSNYLSVAGSHSYHADPLISPAMIAANTCLKGVWLSYAEKDLAGVVRPAEPQVGAYQQTVMADDAGVAGITPLGFPYTTDRRALEVRIRNYGSGLLNNVQVSYQVNGLPPVVKSVSPGILSCDEYAVVFNGADSLQLQNGRNVIRIYTSQPNNNPDLHQENDTFVLVVNTSLNGTYTIGNTGSYATFTEAAEALNSGGVSGEVIFDVLPGTYAEKIRIYEVRGASPLHRVTFRAATNNASSVTITGAANTATENYTVHLAGADFITLRNLTIQFTDSSYSRLVYLSDGAHHIVIDSCILNGMKIVTSTDQSLISNNLGGLQDSAFTLTNSQLNFGTMAVSLQGISATAPSSGILIRNNVFRHQSSRSVSVQFYRNVLISNNDIASWGYTTASDASFNYYGIYSYRNIGDLEISGNRIYSYLTGFGISLDRNGITPDSVQYITNNTVDIGKYSTTGGAKGIDLRAGKVHVLNNTVRVRSDNPGGAAGYFNLSSATQHTENVVKNNVFAYYGTATLNTGSALYHANLTNNYGVFDHNMLYTSIGINLVKVGSIFYNNIEAFKRAASPLYANSIEHVPPFASDSSVAPDENNPSSWLLNGRGDHVLLNTDINGNSRPTSKAAGVPDIGAYEFTPAVLPPLATAVPDSISPYPSADTSQVFLFAGDTVARITWKAGSDIPGLQVRQYSGTRPLSIGAAQNYMYFYTDIAAAATGNYSYDIDLYYKRNWTGTNPDEDDIRLAKKDAFNPWMVVGSLVPDTIRGILSAQNLTSFSQFSGTDVYNPMPVRLIGFTGKKAGTDVLLDWSTASETNNKGFEVQRSSDGRTFTTIGFVKGAGTSGSMNRYSFTDPAVPVNETSSIWYYRLKQLDNNGRFEYSGIISIVNEQKIAGKVIVYPNPFGSGLSIRVHLPEPAPITIELFDITGKKIRSITKAPGAGDQVLSIEDLQELKPGIYFLSVDVNGMRQTQKLVKQ